MYLITKHQGDAARQAAVELPPFGPGMDSATVAKIESLDNHLKFERKRGVNVPLVPMVQVADEVKE